MPDPNMMRNGHRPNSKILVAHGKQQLCELPELFAASSNLLLLQKHHQCRERQLLHLVQPLGAWPELGSGLIWKVGMGSCLGF